MEAREFIYLDVEQLYSLYSQVFEGVADHFVRSHLDAQTSTDASSRGLVGNDSLEISILELSRKTENRFLYDHMYNQLEDKLIPAMKSLGYDHVDFGNTQLVTGSIIKAVGNAEIQDYKELHDFMSNFNQIGRYFSYLRLNPDTRFTEKRREIQNIEREVEATTDRNRRKVAEKNLEKHKIELVKLETEEAVKRGLQLDEAFLSSLLGLTETFYRDRFDVILDLRDRGLPVLLRAVIDRQWLRLSPSRLLALYSGTAPDWTLVGRVTYMPENLTSGINPDGSKNLSSLDSTVTHSAEDDDQSTLGMREAFAELFGKYYDLVRMYDRKKSAHELVVCPLAVYHQHKLPKSDE